MNLRTDLALERHEIVGSDNTNGISLKKYRSKGVTVTEISVTTDNGCRSLGKPVGKYITLEVTPFDRVTDLFSNELDVLSGQIEALLPCDGTVLVAGLGNSSITADSLGPLAAEMIFSTRHIEGEFAKSIGLSKLRKVAAVKTGVLGKTGIETGEIIAGIVEKVKPSALIVIDALASRRLERLGTTVQLSTSGVVPGSGVGNARSEISQHTMGIPVISVGVPTVVDGATLALDLMEQAGIGNTEKAEEIIRKLGEGITVAPKEIDLMTERASQFVAMGINCALQKNISPEDLLAIVR